MVKQKELIKFVKRLFILLPVFLVLQGCATKHCGSRSFYEPTENSKFPYNYETYRSFITLDIADKLKLTVDMCDQDNICMTINLDPESEMAFTSNIILVTSLDDDKVKATAYFEKITYTLSCSYDSNNQRQCTSNEHPPTDAILTKIPPRPQRPHLTKFSFPATATFRGEKDTRYQRSFLGIEIEDNRDYFVKKISFNIDGSKSINLKLPNIELNGVIHEIPQLGFSWITKEICNTVF